MIKSGIKDRNGIEIKEGDIIRLPYIDPLGSLHDDLEEEERLIIFKHGALGFQAKTDFIPLLEWADKKKGDYISNYGIEIIILDTSKVEIQNK